MGFDISFYDKQGNTIEVYEVSEKLHNAIFNTGNLWKSYHQLRKMADYYMNKVVYDHHELLELRSDLERYLMFIDSKHQNEYEILKMKVNGSTVRRIFVAGD